MRNIFFSWQSDLENRYNRNFIEDCIKKAIRNLEKDKEIQIYVDYDRDTLGLSGSPDISSTIFDKIEKSILFIGDISSIAKLKNTKEIPNPNVLIELGYAAKILGWERIICFFNKNTGSLDNLPFDLRQKRILVYDPLIAEEKSRIVSILIDNIKTLYSEGKMFNPLLDYMKEKIDKSFLDICKGLSNLLFETVSMSEGLVDTSSLLILSVKEIENKLNTVCFPAFVFFNSYRKTEDEIKDILKDLFASNYFPKDWANTVIQLNDWIRSYQQIVSPRNVEKSIDFTGDSCREKYSVISGHAINFDNPVDSRIVLEVFYKENDNKRYIDPDKGKVINAIQYSDKEPNLLERICKIKKSEISIITNFIFKFIMLCNNWLEITDSEFILDPKYYNFGFHE